MRKILLLLVLIALVGCNQKDEPKVEDASVVEAVDTATPAIIALMQGSYSSCRPSPQFGGGYYNKVSVTVTGSQMAVELELSTSATCATRYYRNIYSYNISKAAYKTDGDTETVLLDTKSISTVMQFNHAWYVGFNYCGLTWTINVDKDLTGLACVDLLSTYDAFHSDYPAVDQLIFMEMKVKASSLVYPLGTDVSGDTADDRLNTHMFESVKIP